MNIEINTNTSLKDILTSFQEQYSNLKLSFHKAAHEIGEGSTDKQLNLDLKLGELSENIEDQTFHIRGNTKVKTLEQELSKVIGCSVQVYRRSGKIWLQTTQTDEWTLQHQQENGHS